MAIEQFFGRERTPNQLTQIGIGKFTLMANVNETSKLSSTIPVTYLEDGSAVSDHIILNPPILEISGEVGDITLDNSDFDNLLENIQNSTGIIGFYVAKRTQSQLQQANLLINNIENKINAVNRILDDGEQILDLFGLTKKNTSEKTNQELFINSMESAHYGRQLLSINMPYRTYKNMRITSIVTTKTNESSGLQYTIIAQQFRFVRTQIVAVQANNPTPNLNGQTENKNTVGTQTGDNVAPERARSILSNTGRLSSSGLELLAGIGS